jgi:hypothetical protein
VPFSPDNKKIADGVGDFVEGARADLVAQGMSRADVDKYMAAEVEPYAASIANYGQYVYSNVGSEAIGAMLQEEYAKLAATTDPTKRAKSAARINARMKIEIRAQAKKSNPLEQSRRLGKLSDTFLQDWTEAKDAKEVYRAHNNAAGARLAHVEKWGSNNEKYWELWSDALAEAAAMGREVPAKVLEDAVHLINTAQKTPIRRVSARAKKAMESVRTIQNITKLPLAIIPSIAESFFVFNEYGTMTGMTEMGRTAIEQMRKKASGRRLPKAREDMLNSMNMSMDEATSIMASRIADETMNPKAIETWFFNNVTFLPQFTETLRMTAAFQAEKGIQDAIANLDSGDKGKIQHAVKLLYEAGLNPNEARHWAKLADKYTDPYYMDSIRPATIALAEDVVVHPSPLKKPLWHGNENLMLVAHMKSFATVFTNGVMKTWWDGITQGATTERIAYAASIFPVVATFVAMQSGLAGLREWIRTGDTEHWDEQTFYEHMLQGISYLGGVGIGIESVHGAGWGRSIIESLLGPTAADISKGGQAVNKAFSDPVGAVNDLLQMLVPSAPGSGFVKEVMDEGMASGN